MNVETLPNTSGIYKIEHVGSGKIYVGSAKRLRTRVASHLWHLKNNRHHSSKLQHAWNKYGAESFMVSIVEHIEDPADCISREQYWIDKLCSFSKGFNCCPLAASVTGIKRSDETKLKLSKALQGHRPTAEAVAKAAETNRGRKHPERRKEWCENLSKALTGNKPNEATRKKLSESHKGQAAWNKGKTLSDEHRSALSAAHKGYVMPQQQKDKIAASLKNRKKKQ